MAHNVEPEKRSKRTPEASANNMDEPLPGSDGPVPGPNASGLAEPIEAGERASGVDPGSPTPTQKAQAKEANRKEDRP
ncbi:MAG: hypothetical protein LC797_02765 [Chloroflexi bacterium]|nr:hypothetical protein [Chloroflexota bacterium]